MPNLAVISFNSGLLSPLVDARSDLEKYASGCRILQNMIPRIYGAAERRPGTKYIANVIDGSVKSRMVKFIFSSTIAYQIEFGDQVFRVYFDDVVVGSDVVTPYLEADLPQLQFEQKADTMWITHPSYAQRKLTRTSATVFALDTITFDNGPFIKRNDIENDDGVTMTVAGLDIDTATAGVTNTGTFTIESATDISGLFLANQRFYVDGSTGNDGAYTVHETTATTYGGTTVTIKVNESILDDTDDGNIMVTGGTGTLTASSATFTTGSSGHADTLFKLTHKRVQTTVVGKLTSTNEGEIQGATDKRGRIDVKGDFDWETTGTWNATVKLQRNEDTINWEDVKTKVSEGTSNIQFSGVEEEDNVQYRILVSDHTSNTIFSNIAVNESTQDSVVRISSVTSTTVAAITFVTPTPLIESTTRWAEGAWSSVRGYPTAVAFHEQRIVYGGTTSDALSVWFSETDDFENFEEGVKDADSFSLVLPTTNSIRWISSLESLIIGTAGDEWRIRSSSIDAALTPTNFNLRRQTSYGGLNIQAIKANEAILFVDFVGRKVREIVFSESDNKLIAPDLTALAENVTEGTIVDVAYQRNPDSIVWFVLADGTLLSMVYERPQQVVAWAEHPLGGDGLVESVAVIPGVTEDLVYMTVKRTINGFTVRFIEKMQPRVFDNREDAFFVDAGIIDENGSTTITGLGHLEGETVAVLGDGAVFETKIVNNAQIIVAEVADKYIVGLPFRYQIQPMRLDVNTASGTSHGSLKRISELVLSFKDSVNVQYGRDLDNLTNIDFRRTENYDGPPNLFTGDKVLSYDGGFSIEDPIIVTGNDPTPCTLRAIIARLEITGR